MSSIKPTSPVTIQTPGNTRTIYTTGLSLFQGHSKVELSWKGDIAGYGFAFSVGKTGYTMVDTVFNRPVIEIIPVPREITLNFHFPNGARIAEPVTTPLRHIEGSVVQITAYDGKDDNHIQPTVITLQFLGGASDPR